MKVLSFSEMPRPIGIVGLGVTGAAVSDLLLAAGIPADAVNTFDSQSARAQFSDPGLFMATAKPQTLIVSPGVPLNTDWIQSFRKSGGYLTTELELATLTLTTEKIIAVTGSIGKSTVTSALGAAVAAWDPACFVGGNLGVPLAKYAAQRLRKPEQQKAQVLVLELSSYQLERYRNLAAEVGVFTFLTPNHMERYPSLHKYYQTKWALASQSKALVLNKRGGDLEDFVSRQPLLPPMMGQTRIWTDRDCILSHQHDLAKARLLGEYNQDNLALAAEVIRHLNWPHSAWEGLRLFSGLPHRLQNLPARGGISFINDSKATTMESVLSAVETVLEKPKWLKIYLLLGGHDKNLPWEQLQVLGQYSTLEFVFFGEFGKPAQKRTRLSGDCYPTLATALRALPHKVRPGDLVLLSPGGTSHDEFQNFEQRGQFFIDQIAALFKNNESNEGVS